MDEMEEFLGVFFQECEERLGELQDTLALMVDGEWDAETLNAAFRAVHSVKGGAGAFGLDDLVEFTHIFENVMDALRSNTLELDDKICNVLLRSSDMMASLIEAAQGNANFSREACDRLMVELASLVGMEAPRNPDADGGASEPEKAASEPEKAAAEPETPAAAPAAAAADEISLEDLPEERSVEILISPGPDFIRSGHDPLRLIRALRKHGSVQVEAIGDYPPLADHDALECALSWRLTLETDVDPVEIETFFVVYQMTAEVEIREPEVEAATEEAQTEAAAQTKAAPTEVASAEAAPSAPQPAATEAERADAPASDPEPASTAKAAPAPAAAQKAKEPREPAGSAHQQKVAKALRVELSRIDRLVNMVGEIVITQAVLAQNLSEMDLAGNIEVSHAVEALSRQTRELQESVMAIRAQPVKSVFSRMPRVVRDLCASLDKEVKMDLSGEHVEVDTTVIEELSEPLTHMLRNSMDHGIETPDKREAAGKPRQGTIHLGAEHRGERVQIVIEDDGAGINRKKVLEKAVKNGVVSPDATLSDEEIDMLIFHPGFSTADAVTNVSGRGVGMDVVKKKVQALGGRVSVQNTPGKGAKFSITLPLTLAVLDGMTIGVGEERFILPLGSVVEAVKIDKSNLDTLPGEVRVLRYRGDWLPLINLQSALNLDTAYAKEELVVVVETETEGRVAILVDELLGQRQVVLKSLEANFKRIEGVSGATILGDGRVALILDIPALQNLSAGHMGGGFQMEMAS
ncbi:MAG: chemotaxis protein CheA [Pseudomonadota bacterium]